MRFDIIPGQKIPETQRWTLTKEDLIAAVRAYIGKEREIPDGTETIYDCARGGDLCAGIVYTVEVKE